MLVADRWLCRKPAEFDRGWAAREMAREPAEAWDLEAEAVERVPAPQALEQGLAQAELLKVEFQAGPDMAEPAPEAAQPPWRVYLFAEAWSTCRVLGQAQTRPMFRVTCRLRRDEPTRQL